MVKDMFGYDHLPSSCCGAPILRSSGPGFKHLICDGCKRIIKDLTPKDEPRKPLSKKERIRLSKIKLPPEHLTNVEIELGGHNG